ncbi:MAG TPA: hypothetical protein VMD02_02130, partial [Candidatus Omnitrophota bacterium]|nr:hypothetical protein [Candidatus Omnitrophota bacterium]
MGITLEQSRPMSFVKQDLRDKGVKVGLLSAYRLAYYPESTYHDVLRLVDRVSQSMSVGRVKIDPFEKNLTVRFGELPSELIEAHCLKGGRQDVLDLRGIEAMLQSNRGSQAKIEYLRSITPTMTPAAPASGRDDVRELLKILAEERRYFR